MRKVWVSAMSKLRTFRRGLDADAVERAGKANPQVLDRGANWRNGHRKANKPKVKAPVATVVIPSTQAFFDKLSKKQTRAASKPPRVKYLQRLRDVDFRRKVRRYQQRHAA